MYFASPYLAALAFSFLILVGFGMGSSLEAGEQKKFRVGVELLAYFPAYNFSTHGPGDSASYAILESFARDQKIEFEYVALPVNRLYKDFLDKNLDFKFPDNPKWRSDLKGSSKVLYSEPVFDYIDGTMVLPAHTGGGKDKLKKVGSVLGFTIWDYLTEIKEGHIKASEYPDFGELLRAGLKGLVDGVYINIAVGNYHLEEKLKQPKALVFDSALPHTRDSYRLSTLKHPKLLERFSNYLKTQSKDLDMIRKKYKVNVE
jgi:ABC-type amino acid transport substrate-binding protein